VAAAQGLLRGEVLRQSLALSRLQLQINFKISNFDAFYEYMVDFFAQLASGPPNMRIPKSRKTLLQDRINSLPK
jgi:hypothetical protein